MSPLLWVRQLQPSLLPVLLRLLALTQVASGQGWRSRRLSAGASAVEVSCGAVSPCAHACVPTKSEMRHVVDKILNIAETPGYKLKASVKFIIGNL